MYIMFLHNVIHVHGKLQMLCERNIECEVMSSCTFPIIDTLLYMYINVNVCACVHMCVCVGVYVHMNVCVYVSIRGRGGYLPL